MRKNPPKTTPLTGKFPKGWDNKRVQSVIGHYENQSDDEAAAEDEAVFRDNQFTMMAVPVKLVPAVRKLIAKQAG